MKILMINKFLHPNGGSETYIFKLGKQLGNRDFFHGICFGSFCFRLFNFFLNRMNVGRKMIIIRIP